MQGILTSPAVYPQKNKQTNKQRQNYKKERKKDGSIGTCTDKHTSEPIFTHDRTKFFNLKISLTHKYKNNTHLQISLRLNCEKNNHLRLAKECTIRNASKLKN